MYADAHIFIVDILHYQEKLSLKETMFLKRDKI